MSKSKSAETASQTACESDADLKTDLKKILENTLENLDEQEDVVKMKKQAKEVADVATEFIRENPLQAVVGAAVVGLALGYLIGRRK